MSFPFQARFLILHQSSVLLNSLATDLDSGHSEDEAVSEYQYYEFVAIDGPISDEGLRYARGCSSRAEVSRVRWKNEYQFGNFLWMAMRSALLPACLKLPRRSAFP
jgi:hypothetical protein